MKKLIGIVAALAVFFALQACGEGDDPSPGIRLSTETLDFPAGKSTLDLVVSCPQQWRLRVSAGWCYVLGADVLNEPCEGKTFKIGVDGNNSLEGREALITLTGADGTVKTVTVTQGAAEELAPVIESFRFRTAANAAKLPQDVVLEVGDGIISGRTSFVVEDKVLVPEFEFEGGGVYLGAQEVVSGETEVDFSGPVVLTVRSKGGEEREYRVSLVSFTGLPVVYIDTGGIPVVSKEEYVAASLKIVDNNGLRPSSVFKGDVTIKGRGNSTWGMPKKPYRLKFGKKQSLLGEPKDKSWVLLANYMDNACGIRNATAYAIGRLSCLEFTPTTHFVDVFLNDRYNGTYQLCEHMKISEDRVNVTDEGYLLEADQLDRLSPDDVYFRTERILMNIKDPDVEPGSPQYEWIRNYVNEAENALYGADFADPETGYAKYLNVDTYVDWYVISEITKTNDASLYTSCYMNIAPGGKLNMGPIWDFDICMGNTKWNGTDGRGPEGYWNRESPWFERMLQDPAFVRKVKERIGYFKSNLAVILAQVDGEAAYAEASVVEDNRLWHNLKPEGVQQCPVSGDCSQFEITFAIALLWFVQEECDLVFLETGIGGLLDATNVVKHPLVCVITSVSYDHMAILGNTLTQIAAQKAGIIKPGCPVVLSPDNPLDVTCLVQETAQRKHAALITPAMEDCRIVSETLGETIFQYHCFTYTLHMSGRHQVYNALTAIEVIRLLGMHGYLISAAVTQQAFEKVQVPARTQVLHKDPLVLLDGGHNQSGVMALTDLIQHAGRKPVHGICGMMQNKDYQTACGILRQTLDTVICVDDFTEHAVNAETLAKCFEDHKQVQTAPLKEAYATALQQAKADGGMVVVCGSLYLASAVLQEETAPENQPVL